MLFRFQGILRIRASLGFKVPSLTCIVNFVCIEYILFSNRKMITAVNFWENLKQTWSIKVSLLWLVLKKQDRWLKGDRCLDLFWFVHYYLIVLCYYLVPVVVQLFYLSNPFYRNPKKGYDCWKYCQSDILFRERKRFLS